MLFRSDWRIGGLEIVSVERRMVAVKHCEPAVPDFSLRGESPAPGVQLTGTDLFNVALLSRLSLGRHHPVAYRDTLCTAAQKGGFD